MYSKFPNTTIVKQTIIARKTIKIGGEIKTFHDKKRAKQLTTKNVPQWILVGIVPSEEKPNKPKKSEGSSKQQKNQNKQTIPGQVVIKRNQGEKKKTPQKSTH